MMAHAYAVLQFDDGRSVAMPRLTPRQDALVKLHDALTVLEAEHAALVKAHAALTRVKTGRATADFKAELRASGLACLAIGGDTYAVASASRLSVSYTVEATGDDPAAWTCGCMGGGGKALCGHKRRVRQEREAEAKRAARADRPAAGHPTLTVHGRAVE